MLSFDGGNQSLPGVWHHLCGIVKGCCGQQTSTKRGESSRYWGMADERQQGSEWTEERLLWTTDVNGTRCWGMADEMHQGNEWTEERLLWTADVNGTR